MIIAIFATVMGQALKAMFTLLRQLPLHLLLELCWLRKVEMTSMPQLVAILQFCGISRRVVGIGSYLDPATQLLSECRTHTFGKFC